MLLRDQFNRGKDERQPYNPGANHREDDADDHEQTEFVGNCAECRAQPAQPEHAQEEVSPQPGEEKLRDGEESVSAR